MEMFPSATYIIYLPQVADENISIHDIQNYNIYLSQVMDGIISIHDIRLAKAKKPLYFIYYNMIQHTTSFPSITHFRILKPIPSPLPPHLCTNKSYK
jgi:hypothetical protein